MFRAQVPNRARDSKITINPSFLNPAKYPSIQKGKIELIHHLPGVGQNLRDHPMVTVTWSTKPGHKLDPTAHRAQVMARYTATDSHLRNDIKLAMNSCATAPEDFMKPVGVAMNIQLSLAIASGQLTLASPDIGIQPNLDFNYFGDEFDLLRGREAVRKVIELSEQDAFEDIIKERINPIESDTSTDEKLDQWLLKNAKTNHHVSASCKMGPISDEMSVVDQYGNVHGVESLMVVDASIMPDCIRANTNVTSMMIGERVSAFIAGE